MQAGLPQLALASNCAGVAAIGLVGLTLKAATGPFDEFSGGRITPCGVSLISALAQELDAWLLVPTGVARIVTEVSEKLAPPEGGGGAVKMVVARPFESVTRLRAEMVPKSCATPPTAMSRWSAKPEIVWPSALRAVTTTVDCEEPSRLIVSGVAVTLIVVAYPDGPEGVKVDD